MILPEVGVEVSGARAQEGPSLILGSSLFLCTVGDIMVPFAFRALLLPKEGSFGA